jgi:2-polyprenyl-3-methyl-5-hydroxy-6-metoxy-1,4-benzoquinol methylase
MISGESEADRSGIQPQVETMQEKTIQCPLCRNQHAELFCTVADKDHRDQGLSWQILRCLNCGGGWTSPLPAVEQLAACYPPVYLGDTAARLDDYFSGKLQRSRSWRNEVDKVKLVERFVREGSILDVGCADGKFLWALNQEKWTRHGVEFIEEVVRLVSSRMPGLKLTAGDVFAAELRDENFDVITLWHVLEHLPEPQGILNRLFALLKPGGWLFLAVPNFNSLQAHLFRRYWFAFDAPRHIFHFSASALQRLLDRSGFQVQKRLYFSRNSDMHHWKHSLLAWSEARFGNRIPYYLLKPLLLAAPAIERAVDRYGAMAVVSRKPAGS